MVRAGLVLAAFGSPVPTAHALDGVPLWEQRWKRPSDDGGRPLVVRELTDGSVLVVAFAGGELVAVRYAHGGSVLSTAILNAPYVDISVTDSQTRYAIDPFGGIFLASVSNRSSPVRGDIWLLKYDAYTGRALWKAPAIVDVAPPYLDVPIRILIDGSGDATVLGSSSGGPLGRMTVLIKYEGISGLPLWGPATLSGMTSLVTALDPADSVLVSGQIPGSSGRMETYKVDGQTGAVLWGPAVFSVPLGAATPRGIDVGRDGDVVVASTSVSGLALHKYDGSSGAAIWGPAFTTTSSLLATGVTIDPSGDIVLSAVEQSTFHTFKHSGVTGRRLWGPVTEAGNDNNIPPTVAFSGNGDVIVSSWVANGTIELATWRYDGETGSITWGPRLLAGAQYDLRRPLLLVASNGRIFSTAYTQDGPSFFLSSVERDPLTGNPAWGPTQTEVATFRNAVLNDMTHDLAGNILVTGSTPQKPFVTIKYNRLSGAVMWGPVFHTTSPSGAYAVRTDAAGDVFVLGWDGQLVLVKYNGTTGSVAWGPVHVSNVFPFQLEISPSGDAFVAGELPSVLGDDSTLLKFSGATGAVSWGPITFDGGPGRDDFPAALRATAAGDVVVSVTSFGFSTTECMTLKYAGSNGAVLWGPAVLPAARVGDLALDGAGNVILVGETREVDPAMVTIKYNGATGTAIWGPRLAQGSGFYVDGANAVAVSGTGDVFVTGHMYSPAGDYDFATLKYDGATGDLLWGPVLFDGSGAQDDLAYAIALDASGNPVVAGESDGPAMDSDLVILKYDGATGSPLWSPRRVRGFDEDDLPLQNLSVRGTSAVIAGTVDDGLLTLALDEVFGIDNLPEEIPPAYCGLAYALPLAARNPSAPVAWSVISGNLPSGLLLSPSTGLISGTPSALGVFSFRVRATDGVGTSERDFTIHVSDGSAIVPILTTADPLCPGQAATLSVAGSYSSYFWLPGGQASSSIAVAPFETTDYGVLLENGSGCRVRGHRRVFVGSLPVSISAPETVAPSSPGHPASVADFGPGATYTWSILNGSITAGAGTRAVIFSAGASGFATLQVTVTTPAGCSRTVSYSVPIVLLGYYTITPCRVFDTRDVPPSAIAAGSTRTFPVAGRCGIPADARAVTANVTVTEPDGSGHLRLFPAGTVVPPTSTINYRAGQTRANGLILGLGSGGDVAVDSGQLSGTVHLLLDVTGYFR